MSIVRFDVYACQKKYDTHFLTCSVRDLDSSQHACKFYSPSRGRTQPLSQSHADLRDKMGVVLHYFKVLYIILY